MDEQWDQVYAGDVPPDFDQMRKREDRKERIKPFWDLLVKDKEPRTHKDTLIRLMHDLKEEGNTLFTEAHFDMAWMHYRNAIFVVKIMETRFSHKVEEAFTSSLFSNRAFCCLKKDMYTQAVQDCESAITLYTNNIKAYYRQAQSLKHTKKYSQAYQTARMGDMIQSSSYLEAKSKMPGKKIKKKSGNPSAAPKQGSTLRTDRTTFTSRSVVQSS